MNTLPPPVGKIHLLGERNSGANFVSVLTYKAFGSRYTSSQNKSLGYEEAIPVVHFKHMFHHDPPSDDVINQLANTDRRLWLLAVRNLCDWTDVMYWIPWHMCP